MDTGTTEIKTILSALLQGDLCQCTDVNFKAAMHALRYLKKGASELQKAKDADPGPACEPANPGPTEDPLKNPGPAHESLNTIEVVESYIRVMCYSRPDNDLLLRDILKHLDTLRNLLTRRWPSGSLCDALGFHIGFRETVLKISGGCSPCCRTHSTRKSRQ